MLITVDVETRYGLMRTLVGDRGVSRSLQALGEFSESEISTLRVAIGLLRAGGKKSITLVEAGAYIGDMTVPLSRMVDNLIAFEAQKDIRTILEHNLKVNECFNVTVMDCGLGAEEGRAYLKVTDPDSPGSNQVVAGVDGDMEIATLDSLGLDCDLLKADVEGMEVPLLDGATDTIARCRPVLFLERETVENDAYLSQEEVLEELGYDVYPMIHMLWNEKNWKGEKVNPFGSMASFMNFGVPRVRG